MINILYQNREIQMNSEIEINKFLSGKKKDQLRKILIEYPKFIVTGLEYCKNKEYENKS